MTAAPSFFARLQLWPRTGEAIPPHLYLREPAYAAPYAAAAAAGGLCGVGGGRPARRSSIRFTALAQLVMEQK